MLYKTISSKAIIQQVMSRFGINENIEMNAVEWIGYAMGLIGTHAGYVDLIEPVEVDFFKIPQPERLYSLNYILYNGKKLLHGRRPTLRSVQAYQGDDPLVLNLIESIFAKGQLDEAIENNDCCDEAMTEDFCNREDLLNNRIANLIKFVDSSPCYHGDQWYTDGLNGCYDTSIEEGTVYVCYKAYPIDAEGYPLVVDEVKYKLALEWYIVRCLMESGYENPNLSYADVHRLTNKAIEVAANEHRKLTTEQANDFVSKWTNTYFRLRPDNTNYYSN